MAARGNQAAKPVLADALVGSGWNDVKVYHWNMAGEKREKPCRFWIRPAPSHGGHALLGEAAYALGDFTAALSEFTKALAENPRDARLKRRVIRSRRQLHRPSPGGGRGRQRSGGPETAHSVTSEPASE